MDMTQDEIKRYRALTESVHYPVVSASDEEAFRYIGKYLRCMQPENKPDEQAIGQIISLVDDPENGISFRCAGLTDDAEGQIPFWNVVKGVILPYPYTMLNN